MPALLIVKIHEDMTSAPIFSFRYSCYSGQMKSDERPIAMGDDTNRAGPLNQHPGNLVILLFPIFPQQGLQHYIFAFAPFDHPLPQ